MTREEWGKIRYFSPRENWGDPERVEFWLVFLLDCLREFIGCPIVVHCGTQGIHTKGSYHYVGKAVDCHAVGISLLDFYLAAERFPFGGIGIYPCWNNPGLHLDIRPLREGEPGARWGRIDRYVALNQEFIRYLTKI